MKLEKKAKVTEKEILKLTKQLGLYSEGTLESFQHGRKMS